MNIDKLTSSSLDISNVNSFLAMEQIVGLRSYIRLLVWAAMKAR